jgi:hypothetical protein
MSAKAKQKFLLELKMLFFATGKFFAFRQKIAKFAYRFQRCNDPNQSDIAKAAFLLRFVVVDSFGKMCGFVFYDPGMPSRCT